MSMIDTIKNRVTEMPMLSFVVSKLLEIIGNDNHSLSDVVEIVQNDASLTTRVLKVANSAAYFRGNPISTLKRAIAHLGEKTVVDIAVGSCTFQVLNRPLKGYDSASSELWDHSLCAAIAAREIARFADGSVPPDLAFTAGLLHDIGKSIISEFLEGNVEKITRWCDQKKVEDYLEAEKDLVGTNHAEVGYQIALHWKLPEPLCATIKHHHYPNKAEQEHRPLVYLVHLGDMLAMMAGSGTGSDSLAYKIDPGYQDYAAFGKDDLSEVLLNVQEQFAKTKNSIVESEEVK